MYCLSVPPKDDRSKCNHEYKQSICLWNYLTLDLTLKFLAPEFIIVNLSLWRVTTLCAPSEKDIWCCAGYVGRRLYLHWLSDYWAHAWRTVCVSISGMESGSFGNTSCDAFDWWCLFWAFFSSERWSHWGLWRNKFSYRRCSCWCSHSSKNLFLFEFYFNSNANLNLLQFKFKFKFSLSLISILSLVQCPKLWNWEL